MAIAVPLQASTAVCDCTVGPRDLRDTCNLEKVGVAVPASGRADGATGASYVVDVFWPVECGDPCSRGQRLTATVTGPGHKPKSVRGAMASELATSQIFIILMAAHRRFAGTPNENSNDD